MQTGRDAEIGWFPNQWWNNVPFAAPRLPSPDQVWWTANDFATHRLARAYTISLESSFFLLSFIANRVFSTWDWQTRFQWMNKKKTISRFFNRGAGLNLIPQLLQMLVRDLGLARWPHATNRLVLRVAALSIWHHETVQLLASPEKQRDDKNWDILSCVCVCTSTYVM